MACSRGKMQINRSSSQNLAPNMGGPCLISLKSASQSCRVTTEIGLSQTATGGTSICGGTQRSSSWSEPSCILWTNILLYTLLCNKIFLVIYLVYALTFSAVKTIFNCGHTYKIIHICSLLAQPGISCNIVQSWNQQFLESTPSSKWHFL